MSTYRLMHQCGWCPEHTIYVIELADSQVIGSKCYYLSPEEMAESGFEDGEAWIGMQEEGTLSCAFCEKSFRDLFQAYKKRLKKEAVKEMRDKQSATVAQGKTS